MLKLGMACGWGRRVGGEDLAVGEEGMSPHLTAWLSAAERTRWRWSTARIQPLVEPAR
jgi:hypothetical protein